MKISFAGLILQVSEAWLDITDDLPAGSPQTLAKSDGDGVLQFSSISSGQVPTVTELQENFEAWAREQGLSKPEGLFHWKAAVVGVGAKFDASDEILRAWHVTDGHRLILITYVSTVVTPVGLAEAQEANDIVQSAQFYPNQR